MALRPNFTNLDSRSLADELIIGRGSLGKAIHFIDLHCLSHANLDGIAMSFREDTIICDGKFVYWIAKLFHNKVFHIRGIDFFSSMLATSNNSPSHYFFGSSQQVLEDLVDHAKSINAELKISGYFSPPLTDDIDYLVDIARDNEIMRNSEIVWIGLGAPKQILFSTKLKSEINGTLVTVGAAFDFYSHTKPAAPNFLSKIGLEWLFRIWAEPRRLLPRYIKVSILIPTILIRLLLGRFKDPIWEKDHK